jgi:2'-5' RNA ligase
MTRSRPADGHRLFFALWPDDTVRGALARAADGVGAFASGRRVPDDKLHLTLHFLGGWPDTPEDVIRAASTAAATVEAGMFHLVVDRAGGFHGARVGWLAPSGNSGLDALWSGLGRALDDAGVRRRAHPHVSPHVTVRRDIRERLREASIDPVSWPVDAFVLVHSHDGRYDVLSSWALAS